MKKSNIDDLTLEQLLDVETMKRHAQNTTKEELIDCFVEMTILYHRQKNCLKKIIREKI